jgi:hypothetical protein
MQIGKEVERHFLCATSLESPVGATIEPAQSSLEWVGSRFRQGRSRRRRRAHSPYTKRKTHWCDQSYRRAFLVIGTLDTSVGQATPVVLVIAEPKRRQSEGWVALFEFRLSEVRRSQRFPSLQQ